MLRWSFVPSIALLLTVCACGRWTSREPDQSPTQPWLCCPQNAKAVVVKRPAGLSEIHIRLEWINPTTGRLHSEVEAVVRSAVTFYGGPSRFLPPQSGGVGSGKQEAPAWHEQAERNTAWGTYGGPLPRTIAIVCVDPLIILVVHSPILGGIPEHPDDYYPIYSLDIAGRTHVLLPYGFVYGTRFPWADLIEWFSPDMNVKPRPLEFTDGVGRIEVPWGALLVRREGDELVVDAVGKEAAP